MSDAESRWEPLFAAVRRDPADDESWSALYAALWPYLLDWAVARYGLDGDAAGGVLQDAFLQYRDKLKAGSVPDPSVAHLRAFVRLLALTHLRSRERFVPLDELIELPAGGRDETTARLVVDEILDRLDPPCAFLLREKYIVGRSSQELAALTGDSDGNLRVKLHRCRERFRALLAPSRR